MSHKLKNSDILSRFIYSSSHIHWEARKPHTSLFTEKHPNGYSVFHTTDLTEKEISSIEIEHVRLQKPAPFGRCDLEVRFYLEAELTIEEKTPPPRHHNIFGMPVGKTLELAKKLHLRQKMAFEDSSLIIYREKA